MYAYELIKTYMSYKNYVQDKQAAIDLEISAALIAQIKKGIRTMPEKSAIYIATECNLDLAEVLIKLQEEKATDATEKAAWSAVLKKYNHGIIQAITMVCAMPLLVNFTSHLQELCSIERKLRAG